MRAILGLNLCWVLILAACAAPQVTTTPLPSIQISATPLASQGEKPVLALIDGAVIEYRRSGGIAGLEETYTLYADGRLTSTDGRKWSVSPQEVSHLLEQIEKSGFFQAEQTDTSIVPCCDRFSYTLTVVLDGQSRTRQTFDGAANTAAIQQAFDAVAGFIQVNATP